MTRVCHFKALVSMVRHFLSYAKKMRECETICAAVDIANRVNVQYSCCKFYISATQSGKPFLP